MLLIVEGGSPAEVLRRNFHRLRQLRLMRQHQPAPALAVLITQTGRVCPPKGIDEGPHRAGVPVEHLHGLFQIGDATCGKQPVGAGALRDVRQITFTCRRFYQLHAVPCGDIPGVASAAAPWLDVAGFLNETNHSFAPHWNRRASWKSISPLVSFTSLMQRTRSFFRPSSSGLK